MISRTAIGACAAPLIASMVIVPGAQAASDDQLGKTTLDETIAATGSGFKVPKKAKGEPYMVRTDMAKAKKNRAKTRKSMTFFGQLTDPQLADEMSPARLELVDPLSGATSAAWRPQEALGPRVFDSIVRNMNANSTSRVKAAGKKAKLQYALLTGDIADSQQRNEVNWFRGLLNGETIDPFSGKMIDANNPCNPLLRTATPDEIAKLNDDVKNRRYTGVQDFNDWPGQTDDYPGFWDPNLGGAPQPPGSKLSSYANYPKYPGLMDRAQDKLKTQGLKVPWYITRGNHDTLVQGNVPANTLIGGLLGVGNVAVGCQKPWPNQNVDLNKIDTSDSSKVFDQLAAQLGGILYALQKMPLVPPDPDRAYVSKVQFKQAVGSPDKNHGFGYVSSDQLKSSDGNASYYAFNKGKFRIIMLDTNAEGGGSQGNLDDPQYQWLKKELDKSSSVRIVNGRLKRDKDKNRYIIVSSHHTIDTMINTTPDEQANAAMKPGETCTPQTAGCDSDPRNSRPLHMGRKLTAAEAKDAKPGDVSDETVLGLLQSYPNVIAYVNGHTHHNKVTPFKGAKAGKFRGGFWQINTASHVDWAQQSRTIEVLDNRDDTLSIFGTVLNSAAPIKPPKPGTNAKNMTDAQLASLSRQLAANDPQTYDTTDSTPESGGGLGHAEDRNVELMVKNPAQLWKSKAGKG